MSTTDDPSLDTCRASVIDPVAWKMLYNWRLVVMRPHQQIDTIHGYCYFGTDLATLARTVAAGLQWEDPLHSAPEGFDKQAF